MQKNLVFIALPHFLFLLFSFIFLTALFLHDIHCTSFVETIINAKIVRFSHAAAIEIKI
jgi:hypothetical protein